MKKILESYPLKELNSFGLDVKASAYVRFESQNEIIEFLENTNLSDQNFLILGEGSNLLFTGDFQGLILHPLIKGIEILDKREDFVDLRVASGENWDQFVEYCVRHSYGGIENLSLIPGSVGSAPVQNIGAYGVEVSDHILWVEGIDLGTKKYRKVMAEECGFGYRRSIFKEELRNQFLVSHVVFRLKMKPEFILGYGDVGKQFKNKKFRDLMTLRETIIEIRESKLPDPEKIGNAGSFFKNPIIEKEEFESLREEYPEIPFYNSGNLVKIPAAWLIEKAGWKGYREGDAGVWPKQPLVLVNYGNASGKDLQALSVNIQDSIRKKFRIDLEPEVNIF